MPPPQGIQQDNDFEYNLVGYLNRINEEVNVQETNHKQKKNSFSCKSQNILLIQVSMPL
jgi:hypothetical protein